MNDLLDWSALELELNKHYKRGISETGRPAYRALLLFKMSLLQTWYGLSDYEVEERVNDSISFLSFVGLTLEDSVPDNTVLSRFRTTLVKEGAYDKLLKMINDQLEAHNIVLRTGTIVDSSITDSPRKPRGKKIYDVVEDRKDEEETTPTLPSPEKEQQTKHKDEPIEQTIAQTTAQTTEQTAVAAASDPSSSSVTVKEKVQSHVDTEAAWVKKGESLDMGTKST